jgi:hypothetical protein
MSAHFRWKKAEEQKKKQKSKKKMKQKLDAGKPAHYAVTDRKEHRNLCRLGRYSHMHVCFIFLGEKHIVKSRLIFTLNRTIYFTGTIL